MSLLAVGGVVFGRGDVPFGAGAEFVEGNDFGFVELPPVQLEGPDPVEVVPSGLPAELVEVPDDQERPWLSM